MPGTRAQPASLTLEVVVYAHEDGGMGDGGMSQRPSEHAYGCASVEKAMRAVVSPSRAGVVKSRAIGVWEAKSASPVTGSAGWSRSESQSSARESVRQSVS